MVVLITYSVVRTNVIFCAFFIFFVISFENNISLILLQELTRMRERATALLAYKALLPVRFSVDASLALQDIERELLAG